MIRACRIRGRRGSITIAFLWMTTLALFLSAGFLPAVFTERQFQSRSDGSLAALAATEAGAELAIWEYNGPHGGQFTTAAQCTGAGASEDACCTGSGTGPTCWAVGAPCPTGVCRSRTYTLTPAAAANGPTTGTATILVQDINGTSPKITSTGAAQNAVQRKIEVIIQPSSPYRWPAFGVTRVLLKGSAMVDSYDSTPGAGGYAAPGPLGGYPPNTPTDQQAPIRTDGTSIAATTEAIQISPDVELHGSMTVGPGLSIPDDAIFVSASSPLPSIYGDGTINPAYSPGPISPEVFSAAAPVSPPPVAPSEVPTPSPLYGTTPACSGGTSRTYYVNSAFCSTALNDGSNNCYSAISTGNNCNLTLTNSATTDGTVNLKSVSMSGGSTLTFSGNGNIKLTTSNTASSSVSFGSNVRLTVAVVTGKSATMIANSDVTFGGTSHINDDAGKRPKQFTLKVVGARTVELGGSTIYQGAIYAPQSTVNIGTGGNTALWGSVIGNIVELKASGKIHYDRTLTGGSGGAYSVTSWTEVQP